MLSLAWAGLEAGREDEREESGTAPLSSPSGASHPLPLALQLGPTIKLLIFPNQVSHSVYHPTPNENIDNSGSEEPVMDESTR